jgi:peptidyl-prolyl cis-trans isomerase C
MLTTYRIFLVMLCTVTFGGCAATGVQDQNKTGLDGIVAIVNGEPIKKATYKQELDSTYQRFHQSGQMIDGTMFEQLKIEVRESLINLILMDQYSQKLSIKVDETKLEEYYRKAVDKYPSKKAYQKSLKEAGLMEADLKTRLKRTLAAQQVVKSQIEPGITVTREEVRAYYDANAFEFEHDVLVHAAHILIKVPPFADEEARQRAKQRILAIQAKIKAGENFATLANTYSEGPSKVNGGDVGYFGSAQMAPAFETAAFSLKPNEVSDVVSTQFGYHLIKVYDRKPAGKEPFSEAGPKLKARFHQKRLDKSLRELVEKLKAEAKIERFTLD